jgi:hypothetical protein
MAKNISAEVSAEVYTGDVNAAIEQIISALGKCTIQLLGDVFGWTAKQTADYVAANLPDWKPVSKAGLVKNWAGPKAKEVKQYTADELAAKAARKSEKEKAALQRVELLRKAGFDPRSAVVKR